MSDSASNLTNMSPVADLPARYGLGRAALYNRLNYLQLKPEKIGNKAYVNENQLQILDELNEYIEQRGTMEGFPKIESPDLQPDMEEKEESALVPAEKEALTTEKQMEPDEPEEAAISLNGDRITAEARRLAKEMLISQMLGENLAKNPHLLPESDRAEVEAIKAQLQNSLPKEKKYSPEKFAQRLMMNFAVGQE